MLNFKVIVVIAMVALAALALLKHGNSIESVTSFSDSNNLYSCSQPIKVHYETISRMQTGFGPTRVAQPLDKTEAAKYCRKIGAF
jgi:hypothetical protein